MWVVCAQLRAYPRGFGVRLLQLHRNNCHVPGADLRRPNSGCAFFHLVDLISGRPPKSGPAFFDDMPIGDVWSDACMHELYMYLLSNKHLEIPHEWQGSIDAFTKELLSKAGNQT